MAFADGSSGRPANLLDFGAVKDGAPASAPITSAALNAFGKWARLESLAGRAVSVIAPPGTYYFDYLLAANCFKGIRKLVFSGHGAKFLQTNRAGIPWPQSADSLLYRNSSNPRIASAAKGATRVTAMMPSQLAQYRAGEMVMIAGLDIQFNGYPPNLYCFDFVRILTLDTTSGVMTFDTPLSYDYLPNFPEYPVGNYGGSRIYKLDRNGFTWEVDHLFEGFDCRNQTELRGSYVSATGRKITFRDCNSPGFSESICEDFLAERCVERIHAEPDKLVKRTVRRNGDIQLGVGFQSASVDIAIVENCKIGMFAVGGKNLTVRNCTIDSLGYSGLFGFNDSTVFENCRIRSAPYIYPYMPGTRYNYVDGVNVTYEKGVFTILKNTDYGLAKGGGLAQWNVIPGQTLQFCRGKPGDATAGGSSIASDQGAGRVLSTEDGDGVVIVRTTLTTAGVPSWSSGQVVIKRRNTPIFRRCTGAEAVRLASDAEKAGKAFGEYFHYLFAGKNVQQGPALAGRTGRLIRFYANVIKPATGMAGAKVTFSETGAFTASAMASRLHYHIDLDLTVAGKREFTTQSLRGAAGSDQVSYNGHAQSRLPPDVWCEGGMPYIFYSGVPATKSAADLPIIELVFEFDVGPLSKHVVLGQGGRAVPDIPPAPRPARGRR